MLTQTELKSHLHYCQDAGIFTRIKSGSGVKVGNVAGSKDLDGYLRISVNNKTYKAHRLAWLYVHGEFPVNDIDHINCIRDDNRIANLRNATRQQNNLNVCKLKNNTSGYKGVSFSKANNKWRAQAQLNGETKHLGYFKTPKLASETYQAFSIKNHGDFCNLGDCTSKLSNRATSYAECS